MPRNASQMISGMTRRLTGPVCSHQSKSTPKSEHEDDPRSDEDALDDSSGDVTDGDGLVLPPRDRVEHNSRSNVREDEKELQEGSQIDLVVLAPTGDVGGRVVENWLEESQRCDGGDERDDEQH